MSLPNIEHANTYVDRFGATVVEMHSGYVCYDRNDYADLTDDEGNPREPLPEELSYFRAKYYPPSVTAAEIEARIVVAAESDVPAEQIFGNEPEHETV